MEEARGATVRPVVRGSAGIHARGARSSHVRTRRPTLRARLLRRPIRSDRGLHDEPRGDPGQHEIRGRGSGPVIDAHRPRQRFLEEQLATAEGPAVGTILEVKEEKGLGITLDAIIYQGTLSKGDTIVFGTAGKPGTTKVKALLKPKPLDEIRDPQERFDSVASAAAAAGVKIVGSGLERAVAGAPIRVARGNVAAVVEEVAKESQVHVETQEDGILVKAAAICSLEGLAYECKQAGIPIK